MTISRLMTKYDEVIRLKNKSGMNKSQYCSLLMEKDTNEMLELHYELLTRNDRYLAGDLALYFTFRRNKVKTALFLKEKLSCEKNSVMRKIVSGIIDDIGYLTLDELKSASRKIRASKAADARLAFSHSLCLSDERGVLDFHYKLMTGSIGEFHNYIRNAFSGRNKGNSVDAYLLDKLETATRERDIIDLLHILGHRGSGKIIPFIRRNMNSHSAALRKECLIVLGWVGRKSDARLMYNAMVVDSEESIRESAVYALRQMWYHNNRADDLRDGILKRMNVLLHEENSIKVKKAAVFVVQELMNKNFGISESMFHDIAGYSKEKGSLAAALPKVVKALERYCTGQKGMK